MVPTITQNLHSVRKGKSSAPDLSICNLYVKIGSQVIIRGINLLIKPKEIHVIMGPNGSGKSTFAFGLMGHPSYQVDSYKSDIRIGKKSILKLLPPERAKLGLMLSFQNPLAIPGVSVLNFLRTAYSELYGDNTNFTNFFKLVESCAKKISLSSTFLKRSLNDEFSGGEKKKLEMLQLLVLKPKYAIFDEIDTGLDIDALKKIAGGINELQSQGTAIILITHYQRLLNYVKPQFVHVMLNGKFIKEGGPSLVHQIEKKGYAKF